MCFLDRVYKTLIISTIVDIKQRQSVLSPSIRHLLISTIVDIEQAKELI